MRPAWLAWLAVAGCVGDSPTEGRDAGRDAALPDAGGVDGGVDGGDDDAGRDASLAFDGGPHDVGTPASADAGAECPAPPLGGFDMDGDGDFDAAEIVAVPGGGRRVQVRRNDGGTFVVLWEYPRPPGFSTADLELRLGGDTNADGFADLLLFTGADEASGILRAFFGSSMGSEPSAGWIVGPPVGPDPVERFGSNPSLADFDGDGRDDVAFLDTMERYRAQGSVRVEYGPLGSRRQLLHGPLDEWGRPPPYFGDFRIVDWNCDGHPDVVAVTVDTGATHVWLGGRTAFGSSPDIVL